MQDENSEKQSVHRTDCEKMKVMVTYSRGEEGLVLTEDLPLSETPVPYPVPRADNAAIGDPLNAPAPNLLESDDRDCSSS